MSNAQVVSGGLTLGNVLLILVQVLGYFPQRPWVLVLQTVLQALLPSFAGIGHKVAFGEPQVK